MPPRSLFPAALLLGALVTPSAAHAKDLRNRLGVGVNSWFGHVHAVSVRWGLPTADPAMNIQVEGDFGLAANGATGQSDLFAGGRLLYAVVAEDNMNLSLSAGAGYLGTAAGGQFRLQPAATVDFFLFGLENLGFTGGFGVDLDLGSTSGVATTGGVIGGLHYWF